MRAAVDFSFLEARRALNFLCLITGLDVATCGVASATGFGPLATNFSRLVASLATAISSYHFIFIYFFIS